MRVPQPAQRPRSPSQLSTGMFSSARDRVAALRAGRARHDQVVARPLGDLRTSQARAGLRTPAERLLLRPLADDLERLRAPVALQHHRQAMDHDVQELPTTGPAAGSTTLSAAGED